MTPSVLKAAGWLTVLRVFSPPCINAGHPAVLSSNHYSGLGAQGSFHQHAMDYTEIVRCRRRDTAILITAVAVGSVLGITAAVRLLITGWPHISG